MIKQRLIGLLAAIAFSANAGLELTNTYQDWEHYESRSFDTGEAVILGVASATSDANVDTVALRCTTEGVNLLFFNGLLREELGYTAKASLDNGQAFTMDVWIKGKTHWATVPVEQLNDFYQANSLKVELQGDAPKVENVDVSLLGFQAMYHILTSSCK
ncbi:hypothetical protein CEQ50_00785 [Vibrio anguillarum]|uniref:hypothetical protein n=1 Tax=Vibrio anguillarum TaxID=55601 RepID=UPI000B541991|nr:hypothetical protein [Vibrio anguillarum]ASG08704.1 hypothetical protein CEQ50_00785 [Vibrio anguillarum]